MKASEQIEGSVAATESLCPMCLSRIPAQRMARGEEVYLEKRCPQHGSFRTILWRGPPSYRDWGLAPEIASAPSRVGEGCPFECGLCADHRRRTCCVLLEVTQRCNLGCRFCFAAAGGTSADPDLGEIDRWYRALLASGGPFNIQLSGGEPTLRDDLPEIIALGRSLGFTFFQLNTNGLRLARDGAYVQRLQEAGLSCVFLQFDGISDVVHERIRGRALASLKAAAIARCAEHGLGVMLVPTLVPGINDQEIGALIDHALRQGPAVRGVHFQPVSYFGRYPSPPADRDRMTLPEVMRAIEEQTGGKVRMSDLRPPSAENAFCSFHGNFLRAPEGRLQAPAAAGRSTAPPQAQGCCSASVDDARRAQAYVAQRWAFPRVASSTKGCCGEKTDSLDAFLEESARRTFCVSGMAFQDVWNVDLGRLRDCIIHVARPGGRVIPFCAYNLTDSAGKPLYRRGAT